MLVQIVILETSLYYVYHNDVVDNYFVLEGDTRIFNGMYPTLAEALDSIDGLDDMLLSAF